MSRNALGVETRLVSAGPGLCVPDRHQESGLTVDHSIQDAFDPAGNRGRAAHCGLEQDQPKAFHIAGDANVGLHEDVGAAQQALAIRIIHCPQ